MRALQGVFTALVTPFADDGSVDLRALHLLVDWQVIAAIDGLVVCGSTAESPTLSLGEREAIIATTVEAANERVGRSVLVLAATGDEGTSPAIDATRRASRLGADVALVSAPDIDQRSKRVVEHHYRTIADDGGLPMIIHNSSSATRTHLTSETLLRLAEHAGIVGVENASEDLEETARLLRHRPPGFAVLSGNDIGALDLLRLGGDGMISTTANVAPGALAALFAAARAGDWDEARHVDDRWRALFAANAMAPGPVPVKAAMAAMGLIDDQLRAPLRSLANPQRAELMAILLRLGLVAVPSGRI